MLEWLFSTRQEITSVGKDVEQENFIALLLGIKLPALWKTVWRVLRKLKLELPYDPTVSLLGVYLKKRKTLIRKGI